MQRFDPPIHPRLTSKIQKWINHSTRPFSSGLYKVDAERGFASTSHSKINMKLAATDLEESPPIYWPKHYGENPIHLTDALICIYPTSNPSPENLDHLELHYEQNQSTRTLVHNTNDDPTFLMRTLAQDLQLECAIWVEKRFMRRLLLPNAWFGILGETIHATATLRKNLLPPAPSTALGRMSPFLLQSMSLLFVDLSFSTKSLCNSFPPEVTISGSSA